MPFTRSFAYSIVCSALLASFALSFAQSLAHSLINRVMNRRTHPLDRDSRTYLASFIAKRQMHPHPVTTLCHHPLTPLPPPNPSPPPLPRHHPHTPSPPPHLRHHPLTHYPHPLSHHHLPNPVTTSTPPRQRQLVMCDRKHAFSRIRKKRVADGPTDRRTDGRTDPLMEMQMRGRI